MKKPTIDELVAAAEAVAKKCTEQMPKEYAATVRKYAEHYDRLPDADDFFSWLEGYEQPEEAS